MTGMRLVLTREASLVFTGVTNAFGRCKGSSSTSPTSTLSPSLSCESGWDARINDKDVGGGSTLVDLIVTQLWTGLLVMIDWTAWWVDERLSSPKQCFRA